MKKIKFERFSHPEQEGFRRFSPGFSLFLPLSFRFFLFCFLCFRAFNRLPSQPLPTLLSPSTNFSRCRFLRRFRLVHEDVHVARVVLRCFHLFAIPVECPVDEVLDLLIPSRSSAPEGVAHLRAAFDGRTKASNSGGLGTWLKRSTGS